MRREKMTLSGVDTNIQLKKFSAMGIISIACFRPKPRKSKQLLSCIRDHVPLLRKHRLATARRNIVCRAADGTIIEVFEWKSQKAIDDAHRNADVLKLWERYAACCQWIKYGALAEADEIFPGFEPIEL
jgi:hypothetical protein